MFVLVMGGSKAGKSRYAERLAVSKNAGTLRYIATMIPVGEGEEGAACVRRHRAQREGLGFETCERPLRVREAETGKNDTVLLEDVSNLLANGMFCEGGGGGAAEALRDVLELRGRCENLIAVTLCWPEPGEEYDEDTRGYIRALNELNLLLLREADRAVMLRDGVPKAVKGELP